LQNKFVDLSLYPLLLYWKI